MKYVEALELRKQAAGTPSPAMAAWQQQARPRMDALRKRLGARPRMKPEPTTSGPKLRPDDPILEGGGQYYRQAIQTNTANGVTTRRTRTWTSQTPTAAPAPVNQPQPIPPVQQQQVAPATGYPTQAPVQRPAKRRKLVMPAVSYTSPSASEFE